MTPASALKETAVRNAIATLAMLLAMAVGLAPEPSAGQTVLDCPVEEIFDLGDGNFFYACEQCDLNCGFLSSSSLIGNYALTGGCDGNCSDCVASFFKMGQRKGASACAQEPQQQSSNSDQDAKIPRVGNAMPLKEPRKLTDGLPSAKGVTLVKSWIIRFTSPGNRDVWARVFLIMVEKKDLVRLYTIGWEIERPSDQPVILEVDTSHVKPSNSGTPVYDVHLGTIIVPVLTTDKPQVLDAGGLPTLTPDKLPVLTTDK
jgi:hypothetical protein